MAQGDQASAANGDPVQAALAAVSDTLTRRGYLTTEWWTTVVGAGLSAVLALVHINASSATHVVAVAAPALLAALYAITRTLHKSALASMLSDLFPQAAGATTPSQAPPAGQAQPAGSARQTTPAPTTAAAATGPITQTEPDFAFQGIPPIEDVDG